MPRKVSEKEFKTYEQPGMDLSAIGISSYLDLITSLCYFSNNVFRALVSMLKLLLQI